MSLLLPSATGQRSERQWPRTFQFADLEPSPNLAIFQVQFFGCGLPLLRSLNPQPRSDHPRSPGKISPEVLRLPSVKARVGKKAGDRAGPVGADLEQGETPRT